MLARALAAVAVGALAGALARPAGVAGRADGLTARWLDAAEHAVPHWPPSAAADERADASLREAIAAGAVRFERDQQPEPPGHAVDTSHMRRCTACFERAHRASLHRLPFAPAAGEAQLLLDEHALGGHACASRDLEAPRLRVVVPDARRRAPYATVRALRRVRKQDTGGFYGSALLLRGEWHLWYGEWMGLHMASADGRNWSRWSTALGNVSAGGVLTDNVCVTHDPRRRRLLLGYDCANDAESACVASAPEDAPTAFAPLAGGPRAVPPGANCSDLPHCCGAACAYHADSSNCVRWSEPDCAYRLVRRASFGTAPGVGFWREIRGVGVYANRAGLDAEPKAFEPLREWYFDRLGKAERFQRQAYALGVAELPASAAPPGAPGAPCGGAAPDALRVGLLTLLEWPTLREEDARTARQRAAADATRVYLLTSRDGALFDLGAVYAHAELVPAGAHIARIGYMQAASELVHAGGAHTLLYEHRTSRHRARFASAPRIGSATWRWHRLGGVLRTPGCDARVQGAPARCGRAPCACAALLTRPFELRARALTLNVRAGAGGARALVEVLDADTRRPLRGYAAADALPVEGDSACARARWREPAAELGALRGRRVRLRLLLCTPAHAARSAARLFGFTLHAGDAEPAEGGAEC